MKYSLSEERYRAFDITTKVIGGIGAIVLLIIGYLQFKALYVKEFGLKFYSEKIEYVVTVNQLMGLLSTDNLDKKSLEKAIDDFKQVYYIKNVFIEDKALLENFEEFNEVVNTFRVRIKKNKNDSTRTRIYTIDIMNESKELAHDFAKISNEILKNHINQ